MRESIVPMGMDKRGRSHDPSPVHRFDESRPAIPRRVALQQSPPPLPRPCSCSNHPLPFVQQNTANGKQGLLTLSHSRGSPHPVNPLYQEPMRNSTHKSHKNNNLAPGNNLPSTA